MTIHSNNEFVALLTGSAAFSVRVTSPAAFSGERKWVLQVFHFSDQNRLNSRCLIASVEYGEITESAADAEKIRLKT